MAEHHTPKERLQLFSMGWRRGAGMKAIPDNVKNDSDFQNGYREGRIAFSEAMRIAREHYGAPPPSILRTSEATAAPMAALEELEVAATMKEDDAPEV